MSLGADFGSPTDPDSVAASNLAAEGVITVVASGNAGPNPVHHEPRRPLVSVPFRSPPATRRSRSRLPTCSLSSGPALTAITDANGVTIPNATYNSSRSSTTRRGDNSASGISLGCSVAADEANNGGQPFSSNTIIVVARGTCDRVAKAIWGQEVAGAGGVIQVNNSSQYPPYEATHHQRRGGPSVHGVGSVPRSAGRRESDDLRQWAAAHRGRRRHDHTGSGRHREPRLPRSRELLVVGSVPGRDHESLRSRLLA